MKILTKAALLGGVVSILGATTAVAAPERAPAQAEAAYGFDIPAKPLLAALADFTAVTGVQIVRPGADKIVGRSRPVSGRLGAEAALRRMLDGSGLLYEFKGARVATLYPLARDAMPVQLAGEVIPLDDITVTNEGGQPTGGAPGAFTVTAADLARKNPSDIKDVFAGEPGVQVGSSIPLSQKVYVRGVEENNLAVTIDGSAQNNKVFHHNATTYIDPGLLKQARVDPGVAPADAGFGALAGSIAYETKDVADLLEKDGDGVGGFVKSWFNSNGAVFGTAVSGYGKQNGFEALGYFNFANGGKYESGRNDNAPAEGKRDLRGDKVPGTATDLLSGLGKLAYESGEGHRFELSHERVHDDASRPFRANAGNIDTGRGEPLTRNYKLDRQNTVFNYSDTSAGGWWDPKIVFAYSATKIKLPIFERVGDPPQFENTYDASGKTSSLNGKFENKFALAFGDVTAGVDFRNDRATLDDFYGNARERMTNVGVYAQARLEPFDRTRVSFGSRFDHQWFRGVNDSEGADKNDGGVSANASGEYDLIPDMLTAKAGASHVWAGIPLAENFIMNPNWSYLPAPEYGLGRLEAVTSDNFSAGLVARYAGFRLEGSVFRTAIENARAPRYRIARNVDAGATRALDLDSRGFEIGAGYEWENGFFRVKYAHIDIDIDGEPADSDTGTYIATPVGDLITLTAAHTFQSWNVTVGGDVEIAPRYDRVGDGLDSYPAYEIFNAFIEYKPKLKYETTLRLDVKNIFDENYSSRATYGQEFVSLNVTPLFEPGRAFLATAMVKF